MNIELTDDQQYEVCKAVLISDYLRILSDHIEHPPGVETNKRLHAFWELLGYYCTAKEKETLCKWWKGVELNLPSIILEVA
jgi:hypothetical protein